MESYIMPKAAEAKATRVALTTLPAWWQAAALFPVLTFETLLEFEDALFVKLVPFEVWLVGALCEAAMPTVAELPAPAVELLVDPEEPVDAAWLVIWSSVGKLMTCGQHRMEATPPEPCISEVMM